MLLDMKAQLEHYLSLADESSLSEEGAKNAGVEEEKHSENRQVMSEIKELLERI